jgi:hypothetical protein
MSSWYYCGASQNKHYEWLVAPMEPPAYQNWSIPDATHLKASHLLGIIY